MPLNRNAQAWVRALRSGEYKQGIGVLRRNDTYCCLGVACDLYMKAENKGAWIQPSNERANSYFVVGDDAKDGTLPKAVVEWLGLEKGNNRVEYRDIYAPKLFFGKYQSLLGANDGGMSFNAIANAIETHAKGLFKNE